MIIGNMQTDWTKWGLTTEIVRAVEWLRSQDLLSLAPGRVVIDGEAMYANVDEVTTKPWREIRPESHRRYIDVQCVVSGRERVGATRSDGQQRIVEAQPEKDVYFYESTVADEVVWEAVSGTVYVLYPEDIHRPCGAVNEPEMIRKVVVKVRLKKTDE